MLSITNAYCQPHCFSTHHTWQSNVPWTTIWRMLLPSCDYFNLNTASNSKFKHNMEDIWLAGCEYHVLHVQHAQCQPQYMWLRVRACVCVWLHNPQSDCKGRFPPGWVTTLQRSSFSPLYDRGNETALMQTESSSCVSPHVFTGCPRWGDCSPLSVLGLMTQCYSTRLSLHHTNHACCECLMLFRMSLNGLCGCYAAHEALPAHFCRNMRNNGTLKRFLYLRDVTVPEMWYLSVGCRQKSMWAVIPRSEIHLQLHVTWAHFRIWWRNGHFCVIPLKPPYKHILRCI